MSMKNPRVARRYARALMSVAEERDEVDAVANDMAAIGRALRAAPELKQLLASPVVAESRKASVLREVFASRIGQVAMGFLDLLVRKHREVHLEEVVAQFQALRDELRNLITVDVTGAVMLEEDQQRELTARLERRTGKSVRLRIATDRTIMGGLMIRIGDTVLDASVRHQLVRLREQFTISTKE
jgi:F-type H+-transporting ATPase subunit delta